MIMLAALSLFKALASPGILPLFLGLVVAVIDYYYETKPESRKNKRVRALLMFLVTGVIGTVISVYLFAQEASATEAAEARAATAAADQAKTQQALLAAVEQIETQLSNSPPSAVTGHTASNVVVSNRLVLISQALASVNNSGTAQEQATNELIQTKLNNVNYMLHFNTLPRSRTGSSMPVGGRGNPQ